MPKGSSAGIVIDLYPRTVVRLASLLQRQGDIAKLSPTARIKELRFRGFEMMRFHFHRIGLSRVLDRILSSRSAEHSSTNLQSGDFFIAPWLSEMKKGDMIAVDQFRVWTNVRHERLFVPLRKLTRECYFVCS